MIFSNCFKIRVTVFSYLRLTITLCSYFIVKLESCLLQDPMFFVLFSSLCAFGTAQALSSAVCRLLLGSKAVCCKSAKDRTSMAVTAEQATLLHARFGVSMNMRTHVGTEWN